MELKPGYKQAEVGVIPEEWEVKKLGVLCNITTGHKDVNEGNPGGQFPFFTCSRSITYSDSFSFDTEAILIAGNGDVGTRHYYKGKFEVYQRTYVLDRFRINIHYIDQYLERGLIPSLSIDKIGSSIPYIKLGNLQDFSIAVPSDDKEVETIARVLGDVDALLGGLEKLIAKKRDLRRATMQQLLIGQTRLPGFDRSDGKLKQTEVGVIPDDWDVATLSEVCHAITDGTHFTPRYVKSGVPFYSVENVTADNFSDTKFIGEEEHSALIRRCKPERGDILLTRIGSLGDTKLLNWDVRASIYVSLALLKLNDRAVPEFVYSYTKSPRFVRDVEKRSLLNAAPKKINMADIGGVPIPMPRSESEQRAIAIVLSDMDAELAALEARRDKTRGLKQGMMQELLTGRTRIV